MFKRDVFALLGGDSVNFEPCIDVLLETFVEYSFLVLRSPTVSVLGWTQDTSNIAA